MENFESGFGNWTLDKNNDVDWSLQQGQSVNLLYGPQRDHTLGTQFGEWTGSFKSWLSEIYLLPKYYPILVLCIHAPT